jgi:hypothetical protein
VLLGFASVLVCHLIALQAADVTRRNPFLAAQGLDGAVGVHNFDRLERQRPGFEEEEVDDRCCDEVACEENESKGVADAIVGVGREEPNQEVTLRSVSDKSSSQKQIDLPNQLNAVAREACFARVRRGKVSPMTTQTKGPHVQAKDAMNMHALTIMMIPEDGYSVGGLTIPMIAKMSSHVACHRPPMTSGRRRPSLSIK